MILPKLTLQNDLVMNICYTYPGPNVCAMKGDTTYLVGVFIRYSNRRQIIFYFLKPT
jgi:hypothetical protein